VAHRLGIWASRLEAAAFNDIEAEYECVMHQLHFKALFERFQKPCHPICP